MLKVVMLTVRNKDNSDLIEQEAPIKKVMLVDDSKVDIDKLLQRFSEQFVPGTVCRAYKSFNEINIKKVNKALVTFLIEQDFEANPTKIENKLCSLAMQSCNLNTKRWLFDFDNKDRINEFLNDIPSDIKYECFETPNGYAVITEHGFDTRKVLEKYSDVLTNKKTDGFLFHNIVVTGEQFSQENSLKM